MDEQNRLRVLMFPWLAVGHISPFFELAKKLADRGFCIHICSTPINLSFIKNKIPDQYSSSIQLIDLHLPESPELPPHYHTTNGLPLHLNFTLQKSLKMAKPTFSTIMESLKPHLLIYDILMPWAAGVADSHNVPAVRFFTSSAAVCTYFCHMFFRPNAEYPFPELYLRRYEQERAQKLSTEIERKYVDYLGELLSCKVLALGTLVKQPMMKGDDECSELMGWLGEKEERSTVFASFGSEYFLSKEDMEEVAYGLEQSQANFIWVPVNAKLMVGIGVGVEVVRDDGGKLHREDVGRVVKDVIMGKIGETVRKNVKIVGENVRLKSIQEMDEAAVVLAQLCNV
nr:beta-D-glucosyl crocetin beta-1,6-glucosyltransferase-like [Ipomoea trifida]